MSTNRSKVKEKSIENMKDSNNWEDRAKDNPFRVPQGYFESFEERVMSRITEESRKESKRILSIPMIRWVAGVAAVFLLGLIGVQQFYMKPQHDLLNQEAMYEVIAYYAQDLNDVTFTDLIADNEILSIAEPQNDGIDLTEWMDVNEMIIIDALIDMAD